MRACDPRHQLHGEGGDAGIGIGFRVPRILQRLQKTDQQRAAPDCRELVELALARAQRPLDLEDDVAGAERRRRIGRDRSAGGAKGIVRKGRAGAGAGLDDDFETLACETLHGIGRSRDAALVRPTLPGDADLHSASL